MLGAALGALPSLGYVTPMIRTFSFFMAAFLASCTVGPVGKPVPKWTPPAEVPRYGDWTVETQDCSLSTNTGDVKAESDGRLQSGHLIAIKLTFLMPLVRPPLITMSGLPVPMPVDGSQWTFRTYLEYAPHTVAHMNDPGTFLVVSYHPLNTIAPREVHMDTRGLMQGVAHISKVCR